MNERSVIWRAPLVAIAASLGLIGTYLAFGGGSYDPDAVADPCQTRSISILDERDTFELIALSSLDGAACELQVSREELALAIADEESTAAFTAEYGIDEATVDDAVRAGLVRAVDDAAATGRIDGIDETILRELAERAPVRTAIETLQAVPGDDNLQALLEQIAELQDVDLPSLEDLPSLDEFGELLP